MVDQEERLAGVGQRDQQRVVAPRALEGHVHALHALTGRLHDRPVGVDASRLLEELGATLAPDSDADVVDDLHQRPDILRREASTEVAGRRRVGDRSSPERIEVVVVVAQELDVVERPAPAQDVVGDVENVIGLVIGPVLLEQHQPLVDQVGQTERLHEVVHDPDAAVRDGMSSAAEFEVDPLGRELGALAERRHAASRLLEPVLDLLLLSLELLGYGWLHLKSSLSRSGLAW